MNIRVVFACAVVGIVSMPGWSSAANNPWDVGLQAVDQYRNLSDMRLSLEPNYADNGQAASALSLDPTSAEKPVLTLDESSSAPSRIHGFGGIQFSNAYITPRGLNVNNAGVSTQPVAGLIFDLYQGTGPINDVSLLVGAWSDLSSHHPNASMWTEFDFFSAVSVKFLNDWTFSATWMAWMFPDGPPPHTEYNTEFKLAYDDTKYLKEWALHPYVSLFWNYSGDSPVVAGTAHTFYGELGICPSYTLKAISDYPITFTFPNYVQIGDSSFWGDGFGNSEQSNLGVFSSGIKASIPLKFIPAGLGSWNYYIGFTYIHTCNPSLSWVNENLMGAGDSHEQFLGYTGVGFNF